MRVRFRGTTWLLSRLVYSRTTLMTESEFNTRVDELITSLEDAIDASGADIDYEAAGGILTLGFANGSKIIINRQTPVRQVWVAARSGGYHFDYSETRDNWVRDSDGEELFTALSRYCSEQAGEDISLEQT